MHLAAANGCGKKQDAAQNEPYFVSRKSYHYVGSAILSATDGVEDVDLVSVNRGLQSIEPLHIFAFQRKIFTC